MPISKIPKHSGNLSRLLSVLFIAAGCETAAFHRAQVQDNSTDRISVGTVQKEIRVGMSGAEVAQVMGSPNIVSTDEQRREVWIYDKIATDQAYSTSSGGVSALILGFGSSAGGMGAPDSMLQVAPLQPVREP